jgi:hypothetical protein
MNTYKYRYMYVYMSDRLYEMKKPINYWSDKIVNSSIPLSMTTTCINTIYLFYVHEIHNDIIYKLSSINAYTYVYE